MNENCDHVINVDRKQTEKKYVWINQVLYTCRTQDYTGFELQNLALKNEINSRRSRRLQQYSVQNGRKQATWKDYRNVVTACRDAMRKAKAHLELNLARDVKNNKKGFFNYLSSKRKARDNVGPLLNEAGILMTEDAEKAELLNVFFASIFSAKAGRQESQVPEVREEAHREDDFPLVKEDCMRDHLSNLDAHKSMGPDAPTSVEEAGRCHC